MPSIQNKTGEKPFNEKVLNLIITEMPSILMKLSNLSKDYLKVLNLVISGMPSIL